MPSGPLAAAPSLICSFRPETRISKNSSRFDETMQRNFSRSSERNGFVLGLREHAPIELEGLQFPIEEMLVRQRRALAGGVLGLCGP